MQVTVADVTIAVASIPQQTNSNMFVSKEIERVRETLCYVL